MTYYFSERIFILLFLPITTLSKRFWIISKSKFASLLLKAITKELANRTSHLTYLCSHHVDKDLLGLVPPLKFQLKRGERGIRGENTFLLTVKSCLLGMRLRPGFWINQDKIKEHYLHISQLFHT